MGKIDNYQNLFKEEQEVLQQALSDLDAKQYTGNELLPRYRLLVKHYQKLLKVTKKIFMISDSQGQVLQRHQNDIQNLLDNANQGILSFGPDLIVNRQYSAECVRIFAGKIAGLSITHLLREEDSISKVSLEDLFVRTFSSKYPEGQAILQALPPYFKINNKDIRVECKYLYHIDKENSVIMMMLTDVTERLRAEDQVRFLSYHDKLTTLYNRAYVEMVVPELEQDKQLPLSIIMIDLNGLKLANDVFGHAEGDRLLAAMGRVLLRVCRKTDIIARWGGDEFIVLLPLTDVDECVIICDKIKQACIETSDTIIPLSAAIGAATKFEDKINISEMFCVAENRMYNDKLTESRKMRKNIITNMATKLQQRYLENPGHSVRLQKLVEGFMLSLGYDMGSLEVGQLKQLAVLHDIGKISIPKEILGKPGPLNASEWEIMKCHSEIGYRMAQSIGEPVLADIILAIHERWDGQGYPNGIKAKQIPLLARIFALIDVYDVLTHERPYNEAMDKRSALQEIALGSGSQFDPELAKKFAEYSRLY